MATSRMTEQIGRVLGGRYRINAPIGTGASAEVYLADDVTLRRRVAVKVLHPALADDEAFLRRFRAEARNAAALSHPNVMAVYDWGEDDGPYLVLEFLGGGSLRAMLDQGIRLTASQALVVGLDTAQALDFASRRGFVHRDIKPANLLFGDDGRLRIADFGLARALSEAAWTEPGDSLVGTARYAAPEQAQGGRVDGKADVYALGLVLIEAVTGRVPLVAETTLATLAGRVDVAVPVPDEMGPLKPVLEAAGRPQPAERPDARSLARALHKAARQLDRPGPLPLAGAVDAAALRRSSDEDPTLVPPSPSERERAAATVVSDRHSNGTGDPKPVTGGEPTTALRSGPPTAVFDLEVFDQEFPAPPSDAPPRRRRRRWPWLLLLLVLAGAVAGGVVAYLQAQPATAVVPSVDDLPRADAEARLAQAQAEGGLTWEVSVTEDFNEGVPEGNVISQNPPAGTVLEEGRPVELLVSKGLPFRAVPDLSGLTEEEAESALAGAELGLGSVSAVNHESVGAGLVMTWSSGDQERPEQLRKGSEVDIVVSAGPASRTVPQLAGLTADQAVAELESIGLGAELSERFSDSVDAGVVIGSDPGSGASVERGATVTVVVSKGRDLVTVPDIVGRTLDEVIAALEEAGLEPDQVTGPARGSPFTTEPEPGARIDRGSAVDIFLKQ